MDGLQKNSVPVSPWPLLAARGRGPPHTNGTPAGNNRDNQEFFYLSNLIEKYHINDIVKFLLLESEEDFQKSKI